MKKNITIVGGGLIGSLLSILLAKRGHTIHVFEKRPDMRTEKINGGKSINLALSHRGWRSLERVGKDIVDAIKQIAIPMKGRLIHDLNGHTNFQPYSKSGEAIYSVSRGELNKLLIKLATDKNNVNFHFNERCVDINLTTQEIVLENENNLSKKTVKSDLIFGSDGAFSAIRTSSQKQDRFNYSQFYIEHGYKELHIPPSATGNFQLEKNTLHIWPRKKYMMIALPNIDGSFTCTLFFPFEGETSFEKLQTEKNVIDFFQKKFPDAFPLMPTLVEDFFTNPTSSLVTVKCFPWVIENKIALIGDAAHAIVPFFGQGMNCGFEDCMVLDQLIDQCDSNWDKILTAYEENRKPDADAIAELALNNFIEMRDLVTDEKFLLRKKIEAKLTELYPTEWIPLYTMVTFSTMRYSEALRLGKIQDELMAKTIASTSPSDSIETINYAGLINEYKKMK